VNETGVVYCLNLKSGAVVYGPERLPNDFYSASPTLADGKIYVTGETTGITTVFKAGPKFEISRRIRSATSARPTASARGRLRRSAVHSARSAHLGRSGTEGSEAFILHVNDKDAADQNPMPTLIPHVLGRPGSPRKPEGVNQDRQTRADVAGIERVPDQPSTNERFNVMPARNSSACRRPAAGYWPRRTRRRRSCDVETAIQRWPGAFLGVLRAHGRRECRRVRNLVV
jgi:hypothetical protein